MIANPASGRDVRRLVSGASVFDNAEKGAMVHRLLVGLGAAGVERAVMMPAGSGVGESLRRAIRGHPELARPELDLIDMRLSGTATDTVAAVEAMRAANVRAIAVLGGDGTHRVVSTRCGEIPLCALSTGTNNAFPELREATVAGLATGLVATGRLAADRVLRRAKVLRVAVNGAQERDCALVDVATTTRPWVGARAIWRAADVAEAVVAFGEPDGVGLSSLAGLVAPVGRSEPAGVHIRLASSASPTVVVQATLAPGLVTPVGIAAHRRVQLGETVELGRVSGSLALDGERELELSESDRVEVTLSPDGPFVIAIPAAMAEAARAGLLASGR